MFEIIYYLEYEGWNFYCGETPKTKKECVVLAKQLSKSEKIPYKVISVVAEF